MADSTTRSQSTPIAAINPRIFLDYPGRIYDATFRVLDESTLTSLQNLIEKVRTTSPARFTESLVKDIVSKYRTTHRETVTLQQSAEIETKVRAVTQVFIRRLVKLPLDPKDPQKLETAARRLFARNPIHILIPLADENNPGLVKAIPDPAQRTNVALSAQRSLAAHQANATAAREFLALGGVDSRVVTVLYPTAAEAIPLAVGSSPTSGTVFEIGTSKFTQATGGGLETEEGLEKFGIQTAGDLAQAGVERVGKGIFAKLFPKAVEKVGKAAAAKVAAETAGTVAAAVAAPTGPGAILVKAAIWIATEVASRLQVFIRKHWKEIGIGGLVLGVAAASPVIILISLPVALLGAGGAGLIAFAVTTGQAISLLFKSALVTIGAAAIIIILSIPVVVALILFIINSGAYVTPQGGTLPGMETGITITSPYLSVTKTATPNKASNPPLTVTYTVTISAKKGTLSNIRIEESCTMDTAALRGHLCPDATPIPPPNPPGRSQAIPKPGDPGYPTTLSEMQGSYTFSYTRTYQGDSARDSINIDTVTVTADHPEQANTVAAASAAVIIGNPPTECPVGWPIDGTHTITQGPGGEHRGWAGLGAEAIDISVIQGTPVIARHNGTAKVYRNLSGSNGGPNIVEITSNCNSSVFRSFYEHLSSVSISDGPVGFETVLGGSGTAGTGAHLHYEFVGLPMANPYIPRNVTYGCSGTCGDTTPAN